jgi:hypothetical protein
MGGVREGDNGEGQWRGVMDGGNEGGQWRGVRECQFPNQIVGYLHWLCRRQQRKLGAARAPTRVRAS